MNDDSEFKPFNLDVAANDGYLYTTNARLSSILANERLTQAALDAVSFRDKRILDLGCGDGTYTNELFDAARPASIHGVDPAESAIQVAIARTANRALTFSVENAYHLPFETNSFDIAHIRGVLHHLERPADALAEALRVAPVIVVIEPNGYNPILKLIERFSKYHREHGEKSYRPKHLDEWTEALGATVIRRTYAGLVPFFCPDWLARITKKVEPFIERAPLLNAMGCAVYVYTATKSER